jgi:glycosyltransferase involved in cell wall biosynthesis
MLFDTTFNGRIFQMLDALDYGDAVSAQAIELDAMLRKLGFSTALQSKWYHQDVHELRTDLGSPVPTDRDVVIVHYSGYSKEVLAYVQQLRCTKVCIYHNITPHTFFRPGTDLYEHCLKGRQQLREVVRDFHYFWGDSAYNLRELTELGADPKHCSVVPIIVGRSRAVAGAASREPGAWIFLGRIAANKGQANLVRLFAAMHAEDPRRASKLYLVGGFNAADPYFQELNREISRLGVSEQVVVCGKVPDADIESYFSRASIFVSMSEHEGFGVPLIEAAHHDVPVAALRNTAIAETMGGSAGLAETGEELRKKIEEIACDEQHAGRILEDQKRNASRFARAAVETCLIDALRTVLPDRSRFNTVSIVICTYNRSDFLDRCLDYLQYQTNQNFEVIVVNGPSTDGTDEVLDRYKDRVKIGRNPERNLSASRNIGIELSDGDIVAFIDDDAIPFDDWVDTQLREFNQRPLTLAALGGPAYYAGTLEFQAQDIGINRFAETQVNIDSGQIGTAGWERSLLGTNTCFRNDILRSNLGFDEQFDYFLDESELCFRLQSKKCIVGYCPDLFLRHEFAQSHNRGGKYNYNWFTICKNTAYFIAAYSELKGKKLMDCVERRMDLDRIKPLKAGRDAGEISTQDYQKFADAIQSGVNKGLIDAEDFPRTRSLCPAPGAFRPFCRAAAYPLVGPALKRLHICIVSKEFPPFTVSGGIGTLYYHLASELLLMGHRVTVVAPADQESVYRRGRFSVQFAKRHAICSDTLGAPGFVTNTNWSISAFHAVAELHDREPVDIVESALWDSEALAMSLLPRRQRPPLVLRLVTPFPVVSRLNGWTVSDRETALFRTAEKTLIANADAIVPISESIADTIETEYDIRRDTRWVRSHCGIAYWPSFDSRLDYTELTKINGNSFTVPLGSKLVLFVGRLETRKGVDVLLTSANKFLATDSQAHLLLAGRDIEDWAKRAQSLLLPNVAPRVHFLGEVDDITREKLLHAAHCVVFPSRYESFGLVPLEAYVHGKPVVASRAGAIPEVVSDEKSGLLFPPGDTGALARCVERLLVDPELCARLSVGAKRQIRHFSSRNSAIRAVKLYATLLSQK